MNILSRHLFLSILCISVILLITSCSPPNEKAHPVFQKAVKAYDAGKYQEAANGFQEYLDFNRKSAITHEKLAKIYGDHLNDPFLSAYHYRQVLVYQPDSPDREAIETFIIGKEKKFAEKMQQKYPKDFPSITEFNQLKEDYKNLVFAAIKVKQRNAVLQKKLRGEIKITDLSGNEVVVAEGVREVYTVQSGDTLTKIAKKVYGSSKNYKLIYEANKATMKSESALKIGQKLNIPKLKKASSSSSDNEGTDAAGDGAGLINDYP